MSFITEEIFTLQAINDGCCVIMGVDNELENLRVLGVAFNGTAPRMPEDVDYPNYRYFHTRAKDEFWTRLVSWMVDIGVERQLAYQLVTHLIASCAKQFRRVQVAACN